MTPPSRSTIPLLRLQRVLRRWSLWQKHVPGMSVWNLARAPGNLRKACRRAASCGAGFLGAHAAQADKAPRCDFLQHDLRVDLRLNAAAFAGSSQHMSFHHFRTG